MKKIFLFVLLELSFLGFSCGWGYQEMQDNHNLDGIPSINWRLL